MGVRATIPETPITTGRRFPLMVQHPSEIPQMNKIISQILIDVEPMLFDIVIGQTPRRFRREDMEDIVQDCMLHLAQKSLPKYDREGGTQIPTWICSCARNYISAAVTKMKRNYSNPNAVASVSHDIMSNHESPRHSGIEDKIESLAEEFSEHPERFLNEDQARVVRQILSNPDIRMKDHAHLLGYRCQSSLSMIMRRIKEKIGTLDIETHATKNQNVPGLPGPRRQG